MRAPAVKEGIGIEPYRFRLVRGDGFGGRLRGSFVYSFWRHCVEGLGVGVCSGGVRIDVYLQHGVTINHHFIILANIIVINIHLKLELLTGL